MQDDLSVLGVVLVPAVVQRLTGPGQGDRGDQANLEIGLQQAPGQRPVVVSRGLETNDNGVSYGRERLNQTVMLPRAC